MNDLNSVVENIKHGDNNGWSVVYQTYYNKLYRHALSLTDNDPQNAQDAVQGAFARAMSDNRIQTLKDNDKLFQWLSTFVLNEVRPMWRKQEKFMAFSTAEDYENTIDGIADDDICIPEDYAMDEAFKRRMKKAIESLTSQQRIVVQMYYYEGKNIPQIAAAMKLSESSVKTHLTAATAKLKKYIENYEKSGNKFRVIVPIPFLFNKEMPKGIYTAGLKTAGTVMATKVLAGVLAGLIGANVAFGGLYAAGVMDLNTNNNNITSAEREPDRKTESVITDSTSSDTVDTKESIADESSVSADSDVVEVNTSESEFKEYTDGYYSFKFPGSYEIGTLMPRNEVDIFLNYPVSFFLESKDALDNEYSEIKQLKQYQLKIHKTDGFTDNYDLKTIESELPQWYTRYLTDYGNLLPLDISSSEYSSSEILLVPFSNCISGTVHYKVFTSNGFCVDLTIYGDGDLYVDDEALSILESIELNQENFNKLSDKIMPMLIEKFNNTEINYSDNTTHKVSEVIADYFDGNIYFTVSTQIESVGSTHYINVSGRHDGIEGTLSWTIEYQNYEPARYQSIEYEGNMIEQHLIKFDNEMLNNIKIISYNEIM